jgi:leucyl/phenylalanyl-tRNA--protein transferase
MTIYKLIKEIGFPPIEEAEPDGLLAVGGDLSPERVLYALSIGIFPWFSDDEPICWWSPDPRFVIFPKDAKISKSLLKTCSKYTFKINGNFYQVISKCANVSRPDQPGTWITEEIIQSYTKINEYGYAHSFETYYENQLVGGLYGVLLGKVFIGESMFHTKTDASKAAFKCLIDFCLDLDVQLIDCQFHTTHLESLGGVYISRDEYAKYLTKFVESPFKTL